MDRPALESLVDYYLGVLMQAGDYARAVQPLIAGAGAKDGPNAWTRAVTDADLAIQNYLEVATLARDPGLGFFGEESAQSANRRYFDPDAATLICVDPVNGTFLYQNQLDGWDIILSIAHRRQLLAVISYMPARGRFYLATRQRGALTGSRRRPQLAAMEPLRTRPGSGVCVTYNAPAVKEKLGRHYRTLDIVDDHVAGETPDNLNELFTGRVDAFACTAGDLLDWGALAFIVAHAGGRISNLDGRAPEWLDDFAPAAQTDLLIASSPAVHRDLLAALADQSA